MSSTKKQVLKKYYEVVDPLDELHGMPDSTREYIEILTEISNHSARLTQGAVETLIREFDAEKHNASDEGWQRGMNFVSETIGNLMNTCHLNGCDEQVHILEALSEKLGFTPPKLTVRPEVVEEAVRRINLILGKGAASHEFQDTIHVFVECPDKRVLIFGTADDTWGADVVKPDDCANSEEPGISTKLPSDCQIPQHIASVVLDEYYAYTRRNIKEAFGK